MTNKRGQAKWSKKRKLAATVKSQSVSNYTVNASKNKCFVLRAVIVRVAAINRQINKNIKKLFLMHWLETLILSSTASNKNRQRLKMFPKIKFLVLEFTMNKSERVANVKRQNVLKNTVNVTKVAFHVLYFVDAKDATIISLKQSPLKVTSSCIS